MSAFSSETLRLRTAFRKLAKWLSFSPVKVRTSLPSKSNSEVPAMIPSVPTKIQPPVNFGLNGSVFNPRVSVTMVLLPKSWMTTCVFGVSAASV